MHQRRTFTTVQVPLCDSFTDGEREFLPVTRRTTSAAPSLRPNFLTVLVFGAIFSAGFAAGRIDLSSTEAAVVQLNAVEPPPHDSPTSNHSSAHVEHAGKGGGGEHGGGGGKHEGGHEGSEEEEEEEEEHTNIFALEEFNKHTMTALIAMLVVVTIIYEYIVETLAEHFFHEGISKLLLGKMLAELAILGFVSFTATVSLQFIELPGGEETKLTFEYAHVLMFLTAVFFAIEIGVISAQLPTVLADLERKDATDPEDILSQCNSHWYAAQAAADASRPGGWQRRVAAIWHRAQYTWRSSYFNPIMHHVVGLSRLKVLRFHFMARNELLASNRFNWSRYLSRAMEFEIEKLIEINWRSWAFVIVILGASMPIALTMRHALYAFGLFGWMLAAIEVGVLYLAEYVIDLLIYNGHIQRRSAELWDLSLKARTTGSEVAIRKLVGQTSSLKELLAAAEEEARSASAESHLPLTQRMRNDELHIAIRAQKTPTLVAQLHDLHNCFVAAHPEAIAEFQPGMALRILPYLIQTVLLLQCMYQALILTMLGRYAFLSSPDSPLSAIGMLILMWGPTTIMSLTVTPRVLRNYSIAASAVHVRADILDDMRDELMQSGDYSAATQALEMLSKTKLSEADLQDEELVRAKVADLIKLGEMKWRYRVVEEGQSPRDSAIEVLSQTRDLIEQHMAVRKGQLGDTDEKLRAGWAAELAAVNHGLGVTRLIFNTHRGEDGEIETLLNEAKQLWKGAGLRAELADTYNALGSLKQKQKAYPDSERYYVQSLSIRKSQPDGEDHGKARSQMVAQSLTSLGNLFAAMAEEADMDAARRKGLLERALDHLQAAREAYVKGFHEGHPKVAWAIEGIAKVAEKSGDLKGAQSALAEAIAIRRNLQSKDTNKQMFSKELAQAEAKVEAVSEKRQQIKSRMNKLQGVALAVSRSRDSEGDSMGASP